MAEPGDVVRHRAEGWQGTVTRALDDDRFEVWGTDWMAPMAAPRSCTADELEVLFAVDREEGTTDPAAADDEPLQPVGAVRVLLATIGVGVPEEDGGRLLHAVATEAIAAGYQSVIVEGNQVSGMRDDLAQRRLYQTCPGCLREISRYPGGKFYRHHCTPPPEQS